MGVVRLATLSEGTIYGPLNSFRQHQAGLRKAQQSMSRKKKFSQNWKRAKARLACLHLRVANARRDYLHKASTAISKNHAIVCVEDLRVSNMSSSAAGSMQSPGSKVRAKSGLNRSILDQGWAELRRQLEYKLAWNGGRLIAVPAINTSRTCPECGCTGQGNRKTQDRFCCVECGHEANADLVAAINVRRAGLARIACEVNDEVSRQQQEPPSVAASPPRLESPSFRWGWTSRLSYFTYPHLRALFMLAGLEVVGEYGSFAKTPLDNSAEQMIFLLRRAHPRT
jgi:putative transposase